MKNLIQFDISSKRAFRTVKVEAVKGFGFFIGFNTWENRKKIKRETSFMILCFIVEIHKTKKKKEPDYSISLTL
jgi:hypothetical protein